MLCDCGKRSVLRTSWMNTNPGRRFLTCDRSMVRLVIFLLILLIYGLFCGVFLGFSLNHCMGCQYFQWIDPPMCNRSKQIIPGLLRRVSKNDDENKRLQTRNKKLLKWCVISWMIIVIIYLCK